MEFGSKNERDGLIRQGAAAGWLVHSSIFRGEALH